MFFRFLAIILVFSTAIPIYSCASDDSDSAPSGFEEPNENEENPGEAEDGPDDDPQEDADNPSDDPQGNGDDPEEGDNGDSDIDRNMLIRLEAEEADDGDSSRRMNRGLASGGQTVLLFDGERIGWDFDNPDPSICSYIEFMRITVMYANPLQDSRPERISFYLNERVQFNRYLHGSGDVDTGWNFIRSQYGFIRGFRLAEETNTIALSVSEGDEEGIEFDYVELEFECID